MEQPGEPDMERIESDQQEPTSAGKKPTIAQPRNAATSTTVITNTITIRPASNTSIGCFRVL
jgi:hypothetical protein